ncbi:hypothetical protein [Candidatus Magnetominusculus xianensis]|uniref:Uncharacterized protein n=1 Tax=Candidatus Magnetominusculus xianensis TaxID=1748249 RepID=A0ABR5SBV0_9BACT|nr:hypothetical protein [Candidatus Magnetominusculus xianensis]KWT78210.1 hypothetical protein ASN18_2937 [Candidatus Magnetominusculus xianensis]MBF0402838.1 hypothetical protein [Nitrospirota bacterium]
MSQQNDNVLKRGYTNFIEKGGVDGLKGQNRDELKRFEEVEGSASGDRQACNTERCGGDE